MQGWVPASLYGAVDGLMAHPKTPTPGSPETSDGLPFRGKGNLQLPIKVLERLETILGCPRGITGTTRVLT